MKPEDVLALTHADKSMTVWSEEKRRDFVSTLEKRVADAMAILRYTRGAVVSVALERHFLNRRDWNDKSASYDLPYVDVTSSDGMIHVSFRSYSYGGTPVPQGALSKAELEELVSQRAQEIIDFLPSSINAVRFIRPDVAMQMDELKDMKASIKRKKEELKELPDRINMDDLPETMSLGAFKKQMNEHRQKREELIKELARLKRSEAKLDNTVNRALYGGIPALHDAVLKTAERLLNQERAQAQLFRRLSEKVQFGDSENAMKILEEFKANEVELRDGAKEAIEAAMKKLMVAAPKKVLPKALKAPAKKK